MNECDIKQYFLNKLVTFSIGKDICEVFNPKFELQNNKLFVVGVVPKGVTNNNWAEGTICAVSWEDVTDYMIFNSLEDYIKCTEKST